MSLSRIRDECRVPARLGARVTYTNMWGQWDGTIVGSDVGDFTYIKVRLDGENDPRSIEPDYLTFHPTPNVG